MHVPCIRESLRYKRKNYGIFLEISRKNKLIFKIERLFSKVVLIVTQNHSVLFSTSRDELSPTQLSLEDFDRCSKYCYLRFYRVWKNILIRYISLVWICKMAILSMVEEFFPIFPCLWEYTSYFAGIFLFTSRKGEFFVILGYFIIEKPMREFFYYYYSARTRGTVSRCHYALAFVLYFIILRVML